jgi:GNAT superfamily N-acetyltransferase/2'-5' RNA ligase
VPARRRLTVALVVTGPVASEIDGMRRALGAKALQRIAPHLTLVPPLNIAEQSLEDVLGQVRAAGRASGPMAVELGPPSTFWPRTPVVFLELSGDISCVGALRRDLVAGPLAPPKGRDERDFVPHVTLDQSIDPARIPHALAALADYRASYCFERVTVLEQDAEHRWHPMADVALGKPMVVGRGSLELELAVVDQVDPLVAAWAEELWNAYSRERYGPQVRPFEHWAIVARYANSPVGFAEGEVRGAVLRLGRLIVTPAWRGQGVGSHLVRASERLAQERGCDRIRLETIAGGPAENLYAGRGFVVTAALPKWREERDFVVMERALIPTGHDRDR